MAKLHLVACLPSAGGADVRAALTEALGPFEQMVGHPAERDLVERWRFNGGSTGTGFHHVSDVWDDPRLIQDMTWEGKPLPNLPGMCAGGPRKLLDLEHGARRAADYAGRAWDAWSGLAQIHPAPKPHLSFSDAGMPLTVYTGPDETYLDQPLIRAFLDSDDAAAVATVMDLPWTDPVVELSFSRHDVVHRAVERARRVHHLLTTDGWWVWPGRGPVHHDFDGTGCPHMADAPQITDLADMAAFLADQPEDNLLVQLTCRT